MSKIIFYIRMFVISIICIVVSILGFIFSLFRPFHRTNSYYVGRLLNFFAIPAFGFKLKVINPEKFDEIVHPCIMISNHQHNLDAFIVSTILPKGSVTLGKRAIAWIPFFGQMYWLTGNILINRAKRSSAINTMTRIAKIMAKENKSIWIMPEGTRSKSGEIQKFKRGAFITAIAGQFPIVTVAISKVEGNIDLGKISSKGVNIKVLETFETKGLSQKDIPELIEKCRNSIIKGFEEVNKI